MTIKPPLKIISFIVIPYAVILFHIGYTEKLSIKEQENHLYLLELCYPTYDMKQTKIN